MGLCYAISTLTSQSVGDLLKGRQNRVLVGTDRIDGIDDGICLEDGRDDGISVDNYTNNYDTLDVTRDRTNEESVNLLSSSSSSSTSTSSEHDNQQHDNSHPKNYNAINNDTISLSTGESLTQATEADEPIEADDTTNMYTNSNFSSKGFDHLSLMTGESLATLPEQDERSHPSLHQLRDDEDDIVMIMKDKEVHAQPKPPLQPLVYLYRGIIVQMAIILPVGLYWLYGIGPMLLALGQEEVLAKTTENYLRILAPGLWAYSINWTMSTWLQCIDMADVPAYSAFIGCALHIPFNNLYVHKLGFGLSGVAMATVTFQFIQPFCTCLYVFGTSHGIQRVLDGTGATSIGRTHLGSHSELLHAATASGSGIFQYLSLALPGMVAISEWWASEIGILLAGRLHPNPAYTLGGMAIYQSINTFCFMLPAGFCTAASTRVGTALGKEDPRGAMLASRVGITNSVCGALVLGCVLFFTPRDTFPSFFTGDEAVIEVTAATIPFLAFYVFADGITVTLGGVLKGCGRQAILMPIVVFAYWVVGLPLGYYLAFVRNGGDAECSYDDYDGDGEGNDPSSLFGCGVVGLVVGLTTGTWVHCILLALTVYCTVDWDIEAVRAQERLALEKKN